MTGFHVEVGELRKYSGDLAGDKNDVKRVSDLVGQADVGDESWGIVGLFVKQKYTDMLQDLQDLLTDMQNGLQAASDKISSAADIYAQTEDDHTKTWKDLTGQVGNVDTQPGR